MYRWNIDTTHFYILYVLNHFIFICYMHACVAYLNVVHLYLNMLLVVHAFHASVRQEFIPTLFCCMTYKYFHLIWSHVSRQFPVWMYKTSQVFFGGPPVSSCMRSNIGSVWDSPYCPSGKNSLEIINW
jgi:hypothetical protein